MADEKQKEEALEVDGVVTQALANTRFRVQIEGGHLVTAMWRGACARTSSASSPAIG